MDPVILSPINFITTNIESKISTIESASLAETSSENKTKKISHFPLDQLKQDLEPYLDEKGWIKTDRSLPKLNEEQLETLQRLLEVPVAHQFQYKEKPYRLQFTFKTIYQYLLSKLPKGIEFQLVGGFLLNLLGSDWFLECLQVIKKKKLNVQAIKNCLADIDQTKRDMDWRCLFSNQSNISPTDLAEGFIEDLVDKQLVKRTDQDFKAICDCIRQEGNLFDQFHPLFSIEGNSIHSQVANNAYQMSFHNEDQVSQDITIASVLNSKSLLAMQDLWLDVSPLLSENKEKSVDLIPAGDSCHGWQAVIDVICKMIHFNSFTIRAWAKAMFQATCRYRHTTAIPSEILTTLKTYCTRGKASFQIAKLLAHYFQKVPEGPAVTKTLLTFNACFFLRAHQQELELESQDLQALWTAIDSSDLRENQQINTVFSSKVPKQLEAIKTAMKVLPFELVSSIIEIQKFFLLNNQAGEKSSDFLTIWEDSYVMMTSVGDLSPSYCLYLPFQPHQAFEILQNAYQDFEKKQMVESLQAVTQLLEVFKVSHPFQFHPDSAIHFYLKDLPIRLDQLQEQAQNLLASPQVSLRRLGYLLLVHTYALNPQTETLVILAASLPEGIVLFEDSQKELFDWLEVELFKQSYLMSPKQADFFSSFKKKAIGRPSQDLFELYQAWIQTLSSSPHPKKLNTIVYIAYQNYGKIAPDQDEYLKISKQLIQVLIKSEQQRAIQILYDIQQKNLDPKQVHELFETICQFFMEKNQVPSTDQQILLMAIVTQVTDRHVHCRTLFQNSLFNFLKTLMDYRPIQAYSFLVLATEKGRLLKKHEELPLLWIRYCQQIEQSKNFNEAVVIAEEAKRLGVWTLKCDYTSYQEWLITFIDKIYQFASPNYRSLAYRLWALIDNKVNDKGSKWAEKIRSLKLKKESQRIEEQKKRDQNIRRKKEVEEFLKTYDGKNTQISAQQRKIVKDLVDEFCQECSDEQIAKNNLKEVAGLLEHRKLAQLFVSTQELRTLYLDSLKILKERLGSEEEIVLSLLEKILKLTEHPIELSLIFQVISILNKKKVQILPSLKTEILHKYMQMFDELKRNQESAKLCALFLGLNKRKIPIEWSFSFVNEILYWAIEDRLKKFSSTEQIKHCLQSLSIGSFKEKVPFLEQFNFYVKLLTMLLQKKLYGDTKGMINSFVRLCSDYSQEPIIDEKAQIILDWVHIYVKQQDYESALQLMTIVKKPHLQALFVELMIEQLPDQYIQQQPTICAEIILSGYTKINHKGKEGRNKLVDKMSLILNTLMQKVSEENGDFILRFCEETPYTSNSHFYPIVNYALVRMPGQEALKLRVWNLFNTRTQNLRRRDKFFEKANLWADWLDCMMCFCDMMLTKHHPIRQDQDLDLHLTNLLGSLNAWVEMIRRGQAFDNTNTRQGLVNLLYITLNMAKKLEQNPFLVESILESYRNLQHFTLEIKAIIPFEINQTLIAKLLTVPQSVLFPFLCKIFVFLIKHQADNKDRVRKIFDLLDDLLTYAETSKNISEKDLKEGLRNLPLKQILALLKVTRKPNGYPRAEIEKIRLERIQKMYELSQEFNLSELLSFSSCGPSMPVRLLKLAWKEMWKGLTTSQENWSDGMLTWSFKFNMTLLALLISDKKLNLNRYYSKDENDCEFEFDIKFWVSMTCVIIMLKLARYSARNL